MMDLFAVSDAVLLSLIGVLNVIGLAVIFIAKEFFDRRRAREVAMHVMEVAAKAEHAANEVKLVSETTAVFREQLKNQSNLAASKVDDVACRVEDAAAKAEQVRQTLEATAADTCRRVEEVASHLAETTVAAKDRMDSVVSTTAEISRRVNGALGDQMKAKWEALLAMAKKTKLAADIRAAADAEREWRDHISHARH